MVSSDETGRAEEDEWQEEQDNNLEAEAEDP
jgi:hypothetical protein